MKQIFLTAAVLLLPMLCTTAGAAGVFLLRKTGGACHPADALRHGGRVHHRRAACEV